jgi:hypothetical protein
LAKYLGEGCKLESSEREFAALFVLMSFLPLAAHGAIFETE